MSQPICPCGGFTPVYVRGKKLCARCRQAATPPPHGVRRGKACIVGAWAVR